jgi:site-specific DNA-methyltransferase (adenine-specific)
MRGLLKMEINKIYCGDCLELMQQIDYGVIDLILCDLPYGVTQNKADVIIDIEKLWIQYKRILSDNGKIVLTSQFPFTLDLINSNREWFKYDLIWDKQLTSGFLNANRQPLRVHEHILIFYKNIGVYNPQKIKGEKSHSKGTMKSDKNQNYGEYGKVDNTEKLGEMKHPKSIISFMKPHPSKARHPTEKPVELAEWIIKSYSNEGDIVLDNCIGTGWTAMACKKHNRNFIGIDLNEKFVEIARSRCVSLANKDELQNESEGEDGR